VRPLTFLGWIMLTYACAHPATGPQEVRLVLEVVDDNGTALAAIPILIDETRVAITDAQGLARATWHGSRGHRVRVRPGCPDAYREPESRTISLLSAGLEVPGLTIRLICVPKLRTLAVVVRVEGAAGIALRADGEAVATVGPEGSAHVLLHRPRDTSLRLTLDTAVDTRLTPQSPVREVEVTDRDEIVVFDQLFSRATVPKRPDRRAPRAASAAVRHVPYAIGRSR